jgi:predicted ester cyclase
MSERNKALYRRFIDEVLNRQDLSLLDELVSDDFTDHNPVPGTSPDKAGMLQGIGGFFEAFPDMRSEVDFLVAEGDLVVGHHTTTGTHQGDLMGIPATGRRIRVNEIHIVRIVDGQAVEHWGITDDMAMMQQLGVVEAPDAA